jgi:hypothetical protein
MPKYLIKIFLKDEYFIYLRFLTTNSLRINKDREAHLSLRIANLNCFAIKGTPVLSHNSLGMILALSKALPIVCY